MDELISIEKTELTQIMQQLHQKEKQQKEEVDKINYQMRKAKLLLSVDASAHELKEYLAFLTDDYVRAQIVMAKTPKEEDGITPFQSIEQSFAKIKNFYQIKNKLLHFPEGARLGYVCDLSLKGNSINRENPHYIIKDSVTEHKDRNEIKKSLLPYLSSKIQRKIVVDSLQKHVDPELKGYDDLTNEMIINFFHKNGNKLTPEQEERLQIALKENNITFTNYRRHSTVALYEPFNKNITIANEYREKPFELIMSLLHEKMHACSLQHYLSDLHWLAPQYEEGMADVAASVIADDFFSHYYQATLTRYDIPNIKVETPIQYETGYLRENSFMKSMLYGIERSGQDIEAMKEYLLGSKTAFLDKVMKPGYTRQNLTIDTFGNPVDPPVERNKVLNMLLKYHAGEYTVSRENSKYHDIEILALRTKEYLRNKVLPRTEVRERPVIGQDENGKTVKGKLTTVTVTRKPDYVLPFENPNFQGFRKEIQSRHITVTGMKNVKKQYLQDITPSITETRKPRNR